MGGDVATDVYTGFEISQEVVELIHGEAGTQGTIKIGRAV